MGWFTKKTALTLANVVKDMDKNKDGQITLEEIVDLAAERTKQLIKESKFANLSVASEYIILFLVLIFGVIGYFIPNLNAEAFSFQAWIPVISIGLIAGNIIYGGVLKSNFAKQLLKKDEETRNLQATLEANKDALSKATNNMAQLTYERDFWKDRFNELKKQPSLPS